MADMTPDAVLPGEAPVGATAAPVAPPVEVTGAALPAAPSAFSLPSAEATGAAVRANIPEANIPYSDTNTGAIAEYGKSAYKAAGAANDLWMGSTVFDWFNRPKYTKEEGFDVAARLLQVPAPLDKTEMDFLRKTVSNADFDDRMEDIQRARAGSALMGKHPGVAFAVMAVDPAQIGLDVVSGGSARLLGLGRAATRMTAGGMAGAGTFAVGKMAQQIRPTSDGEIIFDALLNGAASAVFIGKSGKMEPVDPHFPKDDLRKIVDDSQPPKDVTEVRWSVARDEDGVIIKNENGTTKMIREELGVYKDNPLAAIEVPKIIDETVQLPRLDTFGQAATKREQTFKATGTARSELDAVISANTSPELTQYARQFLSRMGAMADEIPVVRNANIKVSFYDPGAHAVYLRTNAPPEIVMHEMAHAQTVHKIMYGMANPESAHGALVKQLDELRKAAGKGIKSAGGSSKYYQSKNLKEFVAGLYSGDKAYIQHLAKTRDPAGSGTQSMLSSMVETVRKLLGFSPNETNVFIKSLNLAEQLQDLPLDVRSGNKQLYRGKASEISLEPNVAADPKVAAGFVSRMLDKMTSESLGSGIAWNLNKSMGKINKRIGDLLTDDPTNMANNSIASTQRSISAEFDTLEKVYHDLLLQEMADQGFGAVSRLNPWSDAQKAQRNIEKGLRDEMHARQNRVANGFTPKDPNVAESNITRMADQLMVIADKAAETMKKAGVEGAEALELNRAYFQRHWDSAAISDGMIAIKNSLGYDDAGSKARMVDLFKDGIMRRNTDWDDKLSKSVAGAMVDRALRRGDMSDSNFRGHIGNEGLVELRDDLTRAGVSPADLQRVMDKMAGKIDEANKPSFMKHRIEMDMDASIELPDGTSIKLGDMVNSNMSNITNSYLRNVSGRSAMAAHGIKSETDIAKLRTEFVDSAKGDAGKREAANLYDNVVNALMGRPVGEDMGTTLRYMLAAAQMVGLAASAVWQTVEYGIVMAKYGLTTTLAYSLKEIPGFRGLFDVATMNPKNLASILGNNAHQDIRFMPFLSRLEDGFDIPNSSAMMNAVQQMRQVVPYINGMKYIHRHQSRVIGNVIADVLMSGAEGNAGALKKLERYGLDAQLMDKVRTDIVKNGQDTSKWADGTWDTIRDPLNRMVDDALLRMRTGEIPAFAQFSQAGKFIFSFRSFVLASHNKTLAGGLKQDGYGAVGLILAYQFPLTLAAVQANQLAQGKKPLEGKDWVNAAFAQLSGIGLYGEIYGAFSGDKTKFGSPGTLAIDKMYNIVNNVGRGDAGGSFNAFFGAIPIISVAPGMKFLGSLAKE